METPIVRRFQTTEKRSLRKLNLNAELAAYASALPNFYMFSRLYPVVNSPGDSRVVKGCFNKDRDCLRGSREFLK